MIDLFVILLIGCLNDIIAFGHECYYDRLRCVYRLYTKSNIYKCIYKLGWFVTG